ncbi:SpoIIE family protein phosphatase [candidate division KSB1 bacterium]|nr:SpoIIE family protein phosphatase [candidate division KSB1 bacterium]
MADTQFSILTRLHEFVSSLTRKNLLSRQILTNWWGWFISLLIFATIYIVSNQKFWQIIFLAHLFFSFSLLSDLYKKIRFPIEILLLILYLLTLLTRGLVSNSIKLDPTLQNPDALLLVFQIIVIGIFALVFAMIIVHNSFGKKAGLIWLGFVGFVGYMALAGGNDYFILFFQGLVIIALLQKTRWLEELSKIECWIYIVLLYFFYRTIAGLNPFQEIDSKTIAEANRWYIITSILYYFFKYYLLAMLIRIPVVLVYNHASLSRKLKISGLFQSTFPQLIQFVLLLLIFYSFLSGWQAENLRKSLQDQLDKIASGRGDLSITFYRLKSMTDSQDDKNLQQFKSIYPLTRLSNSGVIAISRFDARVDSDRVDYFIFSKPESGGVNFIKIDSLLLQSLMHDLRYLGGTTLDVHPITPGKWSKYIYESNYLWQGKSQVRIFPFGALASRTRSPLSIPLETMPDSSKNDFSKLKFTIAGQQQVVFGRVYLPFYEEEKLSNRYLAFDIVLNFTPTFYKTGLLKIMLVLLIVYLLINSFVVRQVVKFGSQINETIVQKFGQLKNGIQQISSGNLDYKIKLEGEDEFVELANHFNQMGAQLKKSIAESREKDLFELELKLAREVQLSLLPQQLPEIPGYQVAASMRTANTVGGDFYDIFYLDAHRLLFTIGDVSGKGSSAALYMAQCMSLVRFSRQFTTDPGEIGSRLNSYFAASIADRQIFVTAIIGILDAKSNTLQFIRAGHTEPIYIPGETEKPLKLIESKGIGIGLTRSSRAFERSIKLFKIALQPGDTFLFYTDGVIEAARPSVDSENPDMELYGEERLQKLMKKNRELIATEILQTIEQDVDSFYAGNSRVDDHSVLVIQCCK